MIAAFDIAGLVQQCAPDVHPITMQAVVRTESGGNPYAIGVVGGRLVRQPASRAEAVSTARALEAAGWNYSMGLGQVNRANLVRYQLDTNSAFDPCENLRTAASILTDCYTRAAAGGRTGQLALQAAFSCYYSGNFRTGFKRDGYGSSYVQRVAANAAQGGVVPAVPAVRPIAVVPDGKRPAAKRARDVAAEPPADGNDAAAQRRPWDAFGAFRRTAE